jgi:hypothetical protein
MHIQHPRYNRIIFDCSDTHPAVKQMAEQRRPAYEALRRELREHGFYATAFEAQGDFWIDAVGEFVPFWEAKQLIAERV